MNIGADYQQRLLEWSDIRDHLPTLHDFGRDAKVIELGVRSGNSTAAFLAAGAQVWSVDIETPAVPDGWADIGWRFILDDDLAVVDDLPDQVDVVFIDTVHTYTHTLAELMAYAPKVRPGGVIICHDTELDHAPTDPGPPAFPVATAIQEWLAVSGWDVDWHPGCYGLAVIRKPEAPPAENVGAEWAAVLAATADLLSEEDG